MSVPSVVSLSSVRSAATASNAAASRRLLVRVRASAAS